MVQWQGSCYGWGDTICSRKKCLQFLCECWNDDNPLTAFNSCFKRSAYPKYFR